MKELIIFMPSIEGGGVEKNLFIISNYLSKKIHNVSLITASKKYKSHFNKEIKFISPGFEFWDNRGRKTKYLVCLIILFFKILLNKKYIVFAFQANIYCIILCKILGVNIITRSNSSPSGWSKNFIKNMIFKNTLKKSNTIIVNSHQFKNELKRKFNVQANLIYNPLDKKNIIFRSNLSKKKYYKKPDSLKIINVGRYVDQKDQITLLKALNEIKNKIKFEAILLGRGTDHNKLNRYIKNNQLDKSIKLVNFKKNPYPIIKQSNLFILTSKFEGLPNVLLEAATLKKFIISSNCPTGPNEILLNGKGGLLYKIGNYKQLSKLILNYNKNKKKYVKHVNFTYKKLNRFDYYKNLKKYYEIIKVFLI